MRWKWRLMEIVEEEEQEILGSFWVIDWQWQTRELDFEDHTYSKKNNRKCDDSAEISEWMMKTWENIELFFWHSKHTHTILILFEESWYCITFTKAYSSTMLLVAKYQYDDSQQNRQKFEVNSKLFCSISYWWCYGNNINLSACFPINSLLFSSVYFNIILFDDSDCEQQCH